MEQPKQILLKGRKVLCDSHLNNIDNNCQQCEWDEKPSERKVNGVLYPSEESCVGRLNLTPQKIYVGLNRIDPVSPNANLKLLTKVATKDCLQVIQKSPQQQALNNGPLLSVHCNETMLPAGSRKSRTSDRFDGSIATRKDKSLGVLCDRFLVFYPLNIDNGAAMEISLDQVANTLGTERRRLYDIINVLESLQMASKIGKNRYAWHGCRHLSETLSHLKHLAEELGIAERVEAIQQQQVPIVVVDSTKEKYLYCDQENDFDLRALRPKEINCQTQSLLQTEWQDEAEDGDNSIVAPVQEETGNYHFGFFGNHVRSIPSKNKGGESKKEKSLGIMCQKFIMLFLIGKRSNLVNLDLAAKVLLGEQEQSGKLKTKVRRLYDIANVLTSLGLVQKVHISENGGRKPAFKYIGPEVEAGTSSMCDLKTLPATRHSLLTAKIINKSQKTSTNKNEHIYGPSKKENIYPELHNSIARSKRKLMPMDETDPQSKRLARTKSDTILGGQSTSSKKTLSRHGSLHEILHVAELELQRLTSEERSSSFSRDKDDDKNTDLHKINGGQLKETSQDNTVNVYRVCEKKAFQRHHSDSCIMHPLHQIPPNSMKFEPSISVQEQLQQSEPTMPYDLSKKTSGSKQTSPCTQKGPRAPFTVAVKKPAYHVLTVAPVFPTYTSQSSNSLAVNTSNTIVAQLKPDGTLRKVAPSNNLIITCGLKDPELKTSFPPNINGYLNEEKESESRRILSGSSPTHISVTRESAVLAPTIQRCQNNVQYQDAKQVVHLLPSANGQPLSSLYKAVKVDKVMHIFPQQTTSIPVFQLLPRHCVPVTQPAPPSTVKLLYNGTSFTSDVLNVNHISPSVSSRQDVPHTWHIPSTNSDCQNAQELFFLQSKIDMKTSSEGEVTDQIPATHTFKRMSEEPIPSAACPQT